MSEDTSRPLRPAPREERPSASRILRARRLWPVGALLLAAVAACVTVTALNDRAPERPGPSAAGGAPDGKGTGPLPTGAPGGKSPAPSRTSAEPATPASPGGSTTDQGGSARHPGRQRSVRSLSHPDRYWQVSGDQVTLDPATSSAARRAATFTLVKGLADGRCYSFATAGGGFLRHRDDRLRADRDDGSRDFERNATFCPRRSTFAGATLLESADRPGRFLRRQDHRLRLAAAQNTELYRADSAFLLVDGLS
ncbi:AbfB domain-containing protein [Streptomyces sp. NPDC096012]|uniref:AbfB domain-containing protein n=1 Tax=Streptomyces sp. NPDC096012 TaxID=3155684 RepID=UPI00336A1C4E